MKEYGMNHDGANSVKLKDLVPPPHVPQRGTDDCGVAVLAMVTETPYEEVLEYFTRNMKDGIGRGLNQYWLFDYLNARGYFYRFRFPHRFGTEKKHDPWPPDDSYMKICQVVSTSAQRFHYIVLLQDGNVMDPARPGEHTIDEYGEVVYAISVWGFDAI